MSYCSVRSHFILLQKIGLVVSTCASIKKYFLILKGKIERSLGHHEKNHRCQGCRRFFDKKADLEACEAGHVIMYDARKKVGFSYTGT